MKNLALSCIVISMIVLSGCKTCDCDCQGDLNIQNNTGIDYSFEIKKRSSVIFQGTLMKYDVSYFGLEEGNFTLLYGEQNSLNQEKSFSITDCETTNLIISN